MYAEFSFHEFYNFLPFNLFNFYIFWKTFFFTHDIYPHPHPRPTPTTDDLYTHVQYTQTETIRQTDGPLVPMVRLVPIENDVIPMVLLVNVQLIKGT